MLLQKIVKIGLTIEIVGGDNLGSSRRNSPVPGLGLMAKNYFFCLNIRCSHPGQLIQVDISELKKRGIL